ncbi:hypothetical protein Ancab_032479 [Ancistrocladus abbreviatus]
MKSIELAKGAATDAAFRVPRTPDEMNSANLKKEVFWSGDIHATLKEGGPKIVKISNPPVLDGTRKNTQRYYAIQGRSSFHEKKLIKKKRQRPMGVNQNIGPVLVGPSNKEEETASVQGTLAYITHAVSASEELEPRENKSRPQPLS